jgi:lipopolysaccharide assembly outer membrane protein LptD (OstA)
VKNLFILICVLISAFPANFAFGSTPHLVLSDSLSVSVDSTEKKSNFLDDKVIYNASDSMIVDIENEKAYLYNNAVVIYEDMQLTAGYIEIDFKNNLVYSRGITDSAGNIVQKPISEQGGESFTAGEIRYNFETKKGKIKDVITQQGDGYVHGSDIKKDSNNVYNVSHGKYTTCDLGHPHFYIGAKKIKVIPDDKIVTGPAQLVLMDIPTPLAIPFGYFPNKKGRASGILLPTYGESQNWGFFLKDGGYYFGKSEYFDLALRGDIYSNGSFATRVSSNYKKRYTYGGGLNIGYSHIINGNPYFPNTARQNDLFIKWNHSQDSKFKPGTRFSANVNAGSNTYNTYNGDVNTDYLNNTFQSNISYYKSFSDRPWALGINGRHSQNTISKKIDISLPELTLTRNRTYPFKGISKIGSPGHEMLEKLGYSITLNARNDISNYDSILFTDNTIKQMKNGARANIPINTSVNILKYFTLTPSINLNGYAYIKTIDKSYDLTNNQIIIDTITRLKSAFDWNSSAHLTTLLYGDYIFKAKHLKQIRHVITPGVTLSYKPDFSENQYGFYKYTPIDSSGNKAQYSIFENGIYSFPSAGEAMNIGINLNNTFEAKIKTESDSGSVTNKVKLIENFNIATSYNAMAKNYGWANITMAARTLLFKKLNVNTNAIIDPYQIDSLGGRIEKFEWENQRIGRLTNASLALSTSFRSKTNKARKKVTDPAHQDELDFINSHPDAYVDFNIPWSLSLSYNINYSKPTTTKTVSQVASFSGDLNLTKKWKINVRSGYDFNSKKLSFTSVDIYRDLHCWELSFNWVPFGLRQSYSLTLNVKSSMLSDLKISRRRNWQDYQ